MLKNANTDINTVRAIAIMSWHVHKNFVTRTVNLYNEFAGAQENFDAGGWWETRNLILVALLSIFGYIMK